jgi:hypothetical protein
VSTLGLWSLWKRKKSIKLYALFVRKNNWRFVFIKSGLLHMDDFYIILGTLTCPHVFIF